MWIVARTIDMEGVEIVWGWGGVVSVDAAVDVWGNQDNGMVHSNNSVWRKGCGGYGFGDSG